MRRKYARRRAYRRPRKPAKRAKRAPAALARKKRTRAPRRAPATGLKLSRPMRALVDRRVNAKLETRVLNYMLFRADGGTMNSISFQNAITGLANIACCVPMIRPVSNPHGGTPTADERWSALSAPNQPVRQGDRINPKWLTIRVRLYTDPGQGGGAFAGSEWNNVDRTSIQPYLTIFRDKEKIIKPGVTPAVAAVALSEFWQSAQSAGTPQESLAGDPSFWAANPHSFTGERDNFILGRLNTKRFTPIVQKSCVLTREATYTSGNPVDGFGAAGGVRCVNSRSYKFRVPLPKVFKYSTTNDVYPDNYSLPYIAVGFTYTNGAAVSTERPLRAEITGQFAYTDA